MDQTLGRTVKTQLLEKVSIRKLFMLLSFSLFSLVFSSSNCPSFLQPYNFYISTFPFRLLTHTIDKKCIFLLCNGILVFLAKTSGLIKGSSFRPNRIKRKEIGGLELKPAGPLLFDPITKVVEYSDESLLSTLSSSDTLPVKDTNVYLPEEAKETYPHEQIKKGNKDLTGGAEQVEEYEEKGVLVDYGEEKEVIKETVNIGGVSDEETEHAGKGDEPEEEEDDTAAGSIVMSPEELDKKFDEFIRRMKEEIRIEDQKQQQPVMV